MEDLDLVLVLVAIDQMEDLYLVLLLVVIGQVGDLYLVLLLVMIGQVGDLDLVLFSMLLCSCWLRPLLWYYLRAARGKNQNASDRALFGMLNNLNEFNVLAKLWIE